jgi:hypothetical protein
VPLIKQRKRATRGANINRLPEAVENQNLTIQQCVQKFGRPIAFGLRAVNPAGRLAGYWTLPFHKISGHAPLIVRRGAGGIGEGLLCFGKEVFETILVDRFHESLVR